MIRAAALLCVLLIAAFLAFSLQIEPPAPYQADTPTSEELMDLRRQARIWLGQLKQKKTTTLSIAASHLATLEKTWNTSGRPGVLHFEPLTAASQSLDGSLYWPLCLFDRCAWARLRIQLPATQGTISPELRLGKIPVPRLLWQNASHVIAKRAGLAAPSQQLDQIGPISLAQQQWHVTVANPRGLKNYLKDFVKDVAGPSTTRTPNPKTLEYLAKLTDLGTKPKPKNLALEDIVANVFANNARSDTPREDALAAFEAIVITLSHPRISAVVFEAGLQPRWHSTVDDAGKRLLVPPLWSRSQLNGRGDLSVHFASSGALEFMVNADETAYAGYLKELSDSAKGGSGFDTSDLRANAIGQALVAALRSADDADLSAMTQCLADRDRLKGVFDAAFAMQGLEALLDKTQPADILRDNLSTVRQSYTELFKSCGTS